MGFDILDFLWFLIRLLGLGALVLILASIIIAMISSTINGFKKKRREEMLDNLIKHAIETNNFEVDIVSDKKMNKIKDELKSNKK